MSERLDELGDNTKVVLVTFTKPQNLDSYRTVNQLPFAVLTDPRRSAYRAFGLGRGSVARIYGWRAARRYLQIFRSDWSARRRDFSQLKELVDESEDPLQLGGDFVVDSNGRLVYGFWGQGPDDRPSVDELIENIPS